MNPRAPLVCIVGMIWLILLSGCAKPAHDTDVATSAGRTFDTPENAVAAMLAAAAAHDTVALKIILGPDSDKLLSSGDPIEDRRELDSFVERANKYHELVAGSPDTLVLLVGEDRWPTPVPLVRAAGVWSFDSPAGIQELVLRRIGGNELRTINVMRGFVDAENDYAAMGWDGKPAGLYAQKLRSDSGKHDGLYWEVPDGAPQSPAGKLLADAAAEGYGTTHPAQTPYHGYLYRILTSQGTAANGGARNYVVDGKLTGGVALLAYPGSYGASGIMTFVVNQDGVIWQQDFGDATPGAVASIQTFDPDGAWTAIEPAG